MANQWDKIAIRNINRMTATAQKSFVAASQSVVLKSPVDKGTFKNNWFTEINTITTKTTTDTDKSGGARLKEAKDKSLKIKIGDSLSFANNLPYAVPLEYGHSLQAPAGMVRITAANWGGIVSQVVKSVKASK